MIYRVGIEAADIPIFVRPGNASSCLFPYTCMLSARSIHMFLFNLQEWVDHNLSWNESEYGGIKDLRITPNKLWKPDILMYNRYVCAHLLSFADPIRRLCAAILLESVIPIWKE